MPIGGDSQFEVQHWNVFAMLNNSQSIQFPRFCSLFKQLKKSFAHFIIFVVCFQLFSDVIYSAPDTMINYYLRYNKETC